MSRDCPIAFDRDTASILPLRLFSTDVVPRYRGPITYLADERFSISLILEASLRRWSIQETWTSDELQYLECTEDSLPSGEQFACTVPCVIDPFEGLGWDFLKATRISEETASDSAVHTTT